MGPVDQGARVALVGRTGGNVVKHVEQLMYSLVCMFANVPSNLVEVVIVLDADENGVEKLAKSLLLTAESRNFTGLRVATEPLPPLEAANRGAMFYGHLEGPAGKDRSQYSNFVADRYTLAPVIGMFDVEVCFQVPIIPGEIVSGWSAQGEASFEEAAVEDGKKEGGEQQQQQVRVNNMAEAGGSTWGNDDWFLGKPTVFDVMWPNRFPIFVWREDLAAIRDHLSKLHFGVGHCFEAAFGKLTHQPGRVGFRHPLSDEKRIGFSQFNIMMNYMFLYHPEKYAFAVPTINRLPFKERLALALPDPASHSAHHESMYAKPLVAFGRNGVDFAHSVRYTCCRVHPSLGCAGAAGVDWERDRTLGYDTINLDPTMNTEWLGAAGEAEFEAFMTRAETFVATLPPDVLATQLQVCEQDVKSGWTPTALNQRQHDTNSEAVKPYLNLNLN